MKKMKHLVVGILLIVLGVSLWILPVLPGFVFAVVGYLLIGLHYPVLLRPLEWLASKNEYIQRAYTSARNQLSRFL